MKKYLIYSSENRREIGTVTTPCETIENYFNNYIKCNLINIPPKTDWMKLR
jgi:hypothetical protein